MSSQSRQVETRELIKALPGLNTDEWREWVEFADRDKEEAEAAFLRCSWAEVCFHAQQACEKLLKAFLLTKGIFMPIHDLGRLAEEAGRFLRELGGLKEALGRLTIHYYASRYPNAARRLGVAYDRGVAEACLRTVRELWSVLRPLLGP